MKKNLWILVSILLLHLFLLSQLQFTAWPEMLSFPYLINHGFITYKDMVHVYPPLLVNILAILYKFFGYNVQVLKYFAWASFLVNDILIFFIIKKLTKSFQLSALSIFIYVILQPILEGNMVWPDLAIIPFLLAGFLLLLNKKYFLTGVFLGLALLTKQTTILYVLCITYYVLRTEKTKRLIEFIIGGLIIGLPFLASLIIQKSFLDFLNWTIIYPSQYWTKFPGYVELNPTLHENAILLVLFLPLAFLLFKANKKIFTDKNFLLLFAFLICGIIGVYPRFSFFHFQPALIFLIILYVFLFSKYKKSLLLTASCLLLVLTIVLFSYNQIILGGTRFWSESDLALAKTIQNNTLVNQPIYLLGLNSNLYAFANRLPNKPWLDNFGWYLEIPGVQESVIAGFEKNPPSVVFWQTPQQGNWYDIGTYQPALITDWIKTNYNIKVEIQPGVWQWTKK